MILCSINRFVICENHFEKNHEADIGVEGHIQGSKDGDHEMVIFFGEANPRAIEDRKRLKLAL
jgi:hypothetical protein